MNDQTPTTLGDLLKQSGGSLKTGPFGTTLKAAEYSQSGGMPVISVGEIGYGTLKVGKCTPRVGNDILRRLPEYVLRPGDIVFGRKGAVDRCGLVRENEAGYFLGSDGIRLRLGSGVDPEFLSYQLQTFQSRSWLVRNSSGTTMASLNQEILGRVPVSLPILLEQRESVRVLKVADDLIATLECLIAKKQAIKQGMMQQLLSGRTRLPGFTEPWTKGTFDQLASLSRERAMPQRVAATTPLVDLDQIESGSGRLTGASHASDATSLKAIFKPGDVLFGKLRAYLRKFWYAEVAGLCTTEMWVLRARPGVASRFVRYVVETDSFIDVASGAYGTHMPRSDWGMVRALPVVIPPYDEQVAIGSSLRDIDAEVDLIRQRLQKAQDVKQGLMQQLLTGRTRLLVGDAP